MKYRISNELIRAWASNAEVYARGYQCFRDEKIIEMGIGTEFGQAKDTVWASVESLHGENSVYITFDPDGVLTNYRCNCNANAVWRGACKHVVAVLLAIAEGDGKDWTKIQMQKATSVITESFEKQLHEDISKNPIVLHDIKKVRVHPVLRLLPNDGVSIELSLGFSRLYIVKDIQTFFRNIRENATASYGKNLSFKHSLSAFDATSERLLSVLLEMDGLYTDLHKSLNQLSLHLNNVRFSRAIPVLPAVLDKIFDIYAGTLVSFANDAFGSEVTNVSLCATEPEISFLLTQDGEKMTLTAPAFAFDVIQGNDYAYLLTENFLYRIAQEKAKAILVLLNQLSSLKQPRLLFEGSQYHKFMTYVLPKLRRLQLLDPDSVLPEELIKTTLKPKFYFDTEHKNVSCKVLFSYGETEINPLAPEVFTYRDTYEESIVLNLLTAYGFDINEKKQHFVLSQEEQIYNLYKLGLETLRAHGAVFATEAFEGRTMKNFGSKSMGVRIAGNFLELELGSCGYRLEDLVDAISSFQLKKRYHRLKNGNFISLEDETIQAYTNIISALDINKRDIKGDAFVLPAYRAMFLDELMAEEEKNETRVSRDISFEKVISDFKPSKDLSYTPPESLQQILRPYQKKGFNWLKVLSHYHLGGILADDMGLGKTIQVISLLLSYQEESQPDRLPTLVVTPTSLMYNWEHEIKQFAPSLKTIVLAGLPLNRKLLLEQDADVFITTYDMLKRDLEYYNQMEFYYLIADEAQYIKNPSTQNATAIKTITAHVRFALTGTPIENALSELWSIFDFALPGYLGTATKFGHKYETPIVKENEHEPAVMLRKQIAPFILRRLKGDVLSELPEKVETVLYAEMTEGQKKIYTANLLKARGELDEAINDGAFARSHIKILSELTRLRQICCHPSLFIEDYNGGSGKLDMTLETIQSAVESGHRILLFSQFTSMLSILMKALDAAQISYFYLDGATESRLRTTMADKFNDGDKEVFLISLKAGGTGLNLTGADVVIHYDQWWNPAVMTQASDRAHRYGQKKVVQVLNMITKDSIEEKMLELQSKKKDLVDSVIQEGANFINKMSAEEVQMLFSVTD